MRSKSIKPASVPPEPVEGAAAKLRPFARLSPIGNGRTIPGSDKLPLSLCHLKSRRRDPVILALREAATAVWAEAEISESGGVAGV